MSEGAKAAAGLLMTEAHFPGAAPIDAYGNGGFRFADMSHQGSILCLPDSIHRWDATDASALDIKDFEFVFAHADIEVFLLGLGPDFLPVASAIKQAFKAEKIVLDAMSTGAAVRTYNVLLSEQRAVACGLIAV